MTDINITTSIPLHEFRSQGEFMEKQIGEAGIHIELGADTVARTYASALLSGWFYEQGESWADHFMFASHNGDDEWIVSDPWEDIDSDIRLHWLFTEDQRDLAVLFKLTWGGQS